MSPEERRQAIIAATLPVLLERGPEISTREIARAAGVAGEYADTVEIELVGDGAARRKRSDDGLDAERALSDLAERLVRARLELRRAEARLDNLH